MTTYICKNFGFPSSPGICSIPLSAAVVDSNLVVVEGFAVVGIFFSVVVEIFPLVPFTASVKIGIIL